MFTGLVEGTGALLRTDSRGPDSAMVIRAGFAMEGLTLGESVAVSGACLTVTSFEGSVFTADVSGETLSRTTLGRKRTGSLLNLERALRLGDRLGGHLVSGHVDGIGTLRDRRREGRSLRLFFEVPLELSRYIVEKGSIAVDGVSLTVNGCGETAFDVNIVPHTARETTLEALRAGDEVNIETDVIGKYVEKMVGPRQNPATGPSSGRIDEEFLKKHGFGG